MTDRYFYEKPITESNVTLAGSEAHHLLHVMRAGPGSKLVLFDGRGGQHDAEVVRCGRKTVDLALGPCQEDERELPHPLTLAVALPKGDRQRWLVEKAVELGVTRIVPLRTQHSVASKSQSLAKLDRYVVEASKQCGRNSLMEIASLQNLDSFLEQQETSHLRLFAHPGGRPPSKLLQQPAAPTWVVIGPEGGFSDEEAAIAAEQGWQTVGLGRRLLKVETAAIVLAAAVIYR